MTVRFLYVDDDEDIRELARVALELDKSNTAVTVTSGEEALRVLRHESVDAILLDVMMPGMSGIDAFQAIRGGPAPDTLILFVTARASTTDQKNLLDMGAVAVITKPFDPIRLAARVRQALGAVHDR